MRMKRNKVGGIVVLALGIGVGIAAFWKFRGTIPKGATVVKHFDADKYLGRWYEIARFDFRFERDLKNTTANYSLNTDGSIKVVNRGYNVKKRTWEQATGKAKFSGNTSEGKLMVSFFGPFYSGYNIIALDPNYQYALIAGRNLDYLWLLSRTPSMPEAVKDNYLQKAKSIGYDTNRLIWVQHDEQNNNPSP